jgi:AcrR family transcriptional regulator
MKPRMKSSERRAAILDVSIRQFAEKGFRGTTTRELAAASGVTEPVLYQHFPTKKDLYAAIIEEKACQAGLETEDLTLSSGSDDRDFFTRLARMLLDRYEQDPVFIRLMLFSGLEGHELADMFFQNRVQTFYQMVTTYIERRMESGAYRKVDAVVAARAFVGMVSYHGLIRLLFRDRVVQAERPRIIEQMVELFLEGIRTRQ